MWLPAPSRGGRYAERLSKDPVHFRSCPTCGSCLWGEYTPQPELRLLAACTLDDTSWLRPVARLWTRSGDRGNPFRRSYELPPNVQLR